MLPAIPHDSDELERVERRPISSPGSQKVHVVAIRQVRYPETGLILSLVHGNVLLEKVFLAARWPARPPLLLNACEIFVVAPNIAMICLVKKIQAA